MADGSAIVSCMQHPCYARTRVCVGLRGVNIGKRTGGKVLRCEGTRALVQLCMANPTFVKSCWAYRITQTERVPSPGRRSHESMSKRECVIRHRILSVQQRWCRHAAETRPSETETVLLVCWRFRKRQTG